MAESAGSPDRLCPACGAELRPDATVCWLCAYRSPAAMGHPGDAATGRRSPAGAVVGFVLSVLLLVLALPVAAVIALFCICVTPTISRGGGPPDMLQTVILLVGGAFVVLTSLVMLVVYFGSRLRR